MPLGLSLDQGENFRDHEMANETTGLGTVAFLRDNDSDVKLHKRKCMSTAIIRDVSVVSSNSDIESFTTTRLGVQWSQRVVGYLEAQMERHKSGVESCE